MSSGDWFRQTSWTSKDRDNFFLRFNKARKYNKSQYLRVQAVHLLDTGKRREIRGAMELLNLLIDEWPNPIELESAHYIKARCLEIIGHFEEVVMEYRKALEARRNKPNVRTGAPLGYAIYVVQNKRTDLYDEITKILEELVSENDIIFPIDKYRYFAVFAHIADHYGQKVRAKECADRALQAAELTHTGLSRHPTIGLVTNKNDKMIAKLRKISGK